MNLLDEAKSIADWIVNLRRQIHRHPELTYREIHTSQLVRATLDELGIPYRYPLAATGIVAMLGDGNGPGVALRADMDALPIREEAEVSFRSEVDGKMHACGHDCHTAMLLGAARLLKSHEAELRGTVKLIFQPAEESGAGTIACAATGRLSTRTWNGSSASTFGRGCRRERSPSARAWSWPRWVCSSSRCGAKAATGQCRTLPSIRLCARPR